MLRLSTINILVAAGNRIDRASTWLELLELEIYQKPLTGFDMRIVYAWSAL